MIALDTNLLVYAHRRESSYHGRANDLVRGLAQGKARWAIPWPCIYEFFSVVTNPRIWKETASTPIQASNQIEAWCNSPNLSLLGETQDFLTVLIRLMRQPRVRGPIVHDARIAALCMVHGVEELLTIDRDFQLFDQLRIRNPLFD
ncbi:MAG: PIN domain-containing protein [Gammaproteobacteria bacterium]|nr:PIN domain-containing protein [Gammaproteobacteria bacterium]